MIFADCDSLLIEISLLFNEEDSGNVVVVISLVAVTVVTTVEDDTEGPDSALHEQVSFAVSFDCFHH